MHTDNPAERLLNILNEGERKQLKMSSKQVWAELLDVNQDNLALLMSRLGKVMELPEQIINQVHKHYPDQDDMHQHWSKKVNTAFTSHNLNGLWEQFIGHIDEHSINYLRMTVDLLDMKETTKILSSEQLLKIHENINDILAEVIEMEIDVEFKKYIVTYLRKILTSIEEYKISGAAPIMESIETLLGHAFIDEAYRKNIMETDFGSKLTTALSAVASIVTIAVGLPQLPDAFRFFLAPPK